MYINIVRIGVARLLFFSSNWLSTWRRRWLNQLWLKECIDRLSLPWSSLGIILIESFFFQNNFKGIETHNMSLICLPFSSRINDLFWATTVYINQIGIRIRGHRQKVCTQSQFHIHLTLILNQYQFSLKNVCKHEIDMSGCYDNKKWQQICKTHAVEASCRFGHEM